MTPSTPTAPAREAAPVVTPKKPETRPAGEQVRDARDELGLKQEELAERLKIRRASLSAVETGGNTTLELLQELATALGRPLVIVPGLPKPKVDREGRTSKKNARRP